MYITEGASFGLGGFSLSTEIKTPLLPIIYVFWDTLYLARTISQLRVINQNPSSLENNEPLINGVH